MTGSTPSRADMVYRLAREEVATMKKDLAKAGLGDGEMLAFMVVMLGVLTARTINTTSSDSAIKALNEKIIADVLAQVRAQIETEEALLQRDRAGVLQ